MKLDDVTPRTMDKFYQSLLSVKAKVVNNHKPNNEYLTVHTVREIHKLLRNAFNQAVKWELMSRNPVLNATLEEQFYQTKAAPADCETQEEKTPETAQSDQEILLKLLANPEMKALLKSLAKNLCEQ